MYRSLRFVCKPIKFRKMSRKKHKSFFLVRLTQPIAAQLGIMKITLNEVIK